MTAVPFDTLALARRLRDDGKMSPEQAEGVAKALGEAFREEISTKADLQLLERDLKIWFGKMLAWQTGVLIAVMAVMKFLGH